MGKGNPHRRSANARNARVPATRTRTRRQKPKLSDPEQNSLDLAHQLRTLGLYPANTIGDGNCLFRALCDQLHGSPKQHLTLRKEICDWLEAHKEHYEGFVEDDRTFAQHVASMRVAGTYGGHLELSAFAHLKRRNVKVIQPGLVYVIEWNTGPAQIEPAVVEPSESAAEEQITSSLTPREQRLLKRSKARDAKEAERKKATVSAPPNPTTANQPDVGPDGLPLGAVYVAYHDWEHFSSVRNLTGPHQGIPYVRERQLSDNSRSTSPPTHLSASLPPSNNQLRDSPSSSDTTSLPATATDSSSAPSSQVPQTPPDSTSLASNSIKGATGFSKGRSPKRVFDETEDGEFASESEHGRAESKRRGRLRSSLLHEASISTQLTSSTTDVSQVDPDQSQTETQLDLGLDSNETDSPGDDEDMGDDGLETPLESSTTSSLPDRDRSRHSRRSTAPSERLTRRQRKALGIPKPKPKRVVLLVEKKGTPSVKSDTSSTASWAANGSGKLDVRGFRELKI